MADKDDDMPDNVVSLASRVAAKTSPTSTIDLEARALFELVQRYDSVAIVGWSDETESLDVISAENDMAVLYELLQQAAANIALEALEATFTGSVH